MKINLKGPEGNAFVILGKTTQLLRAQGKSEKEIEAIMAQATSGDYDYLLDVCADASGIIYTGRKKKKSS